MIRSLLLTGAGIFLVLGVAHAVLTLRDLRLPRTFTPTDDAVRDAMHRSRLALSARTNVWDAWLGFNLSHALGLIMFGGSLIVIGWRHLPLFEGALSIKLAALVVSATYTVLSARFFFPVPTAAAAVGFLCFLGAAGLSVV